MLGSSLSSSITRAIAFAILATAATGQNFRIETKVYLTPKEQGKETLVSENLTIFRGGIVYDFLKHQPGARPSGDVTILDPTPRGQRMIVMDPNRQVKIEMPWKEIDDFLRKVHAAAEGNDDPFIRFLANPKFTEGWDARAKRLVLSSDWMKYDLQTTDFPDDGARRQYRDFRNWYAKLNCMSNPLSLPPFARLEVNRHLDHRKQIPREVRLVLFLQERHVKIRSMHAIQWNLTQADAEQIRQADKQYKDFKTISFPEYHRQPQQTQRPKDAPRR
ncbi:MAG: hypothetical protein N2C14_04930 [Planctomycetales bacterium]